MEDNQKTILKISMLEQQAQQIHQQLEIVEKTIVEMESLEKGLEEIVGKRDKEILASLGKGIFIKSKILSEELFVDIGGGNVIKKTIPETKELIREQIEKLKNIKTELESSLINIEKESLEILEEAREI